VYIPPGALVYIPAGVQPPTTPIVRNNGKMLSSRRLTLFSVLLFSLAVASRPLPAKKSPKPDKELTMAIEAEHNGDFDTALALISSAIGKKPGDIAYKIASYRIHFEAAAAHVHHAIGVRNSGNLPEALKELEKAVEIDPSSDTARQEVRRTKQMIERNSRGEGNLLPPDDGKDIKALTPVELERKKSADKVASIMPAAELKPLSTDPINLKMINQKPKVLFDTIGKYAGINVIFDPDYETQNTSKPQTLDLVNASLNEALDDVGMLTKSYWKPLGPNTIFVTLDNRQKRQEYEEQVVKVFYLQNVGQQAELNEAVTVLRTVADIQKVFTSTPMNAIVVRASADKIPLAEKLIAAIDKPKSEVIVDVMVMEVSRNYMRNLAAAIGVGGINSPITFTPRASLTGENTGSASTTGTGTTGTGTTGTGTAGNQTTFNNTVLMPNIKHISTSDYTISNVPGGLIEALLTDSSTKVLQAPQMRALDNFKTTLKVGEKIPTATGSFQPGVGGVGINPLVNTQFTYLDVGVNVDMLPRVNSATEVSAHITVEVSQESGTVNLGGIDQPVIGQRRVEMDLRMRDGEVNLIGGLINEQDNKSISGIPGLASLPGIGNLFKSTNVTRSQQELLIVMVPHIIRSPDITDEDLRAVATGNETSYRMTYAQARPPVKPQSAAPAPGPTGAPPATAPAMSPATVPATAPPGAPPAAAPPVTPPPAPVPQAIPQPAPPNAGMPAATGPVAVSFTPAQPDVPVGSTIPVNVQVSNVNDLAALQMTMKFDPKVLHINTLMSGDLIKRNGPDLVPSRNVLNDTGDAAIGIARDPSSGGVSGSGGVITIVFQAVAKGTTTITIPQFTMTGSTGQPIVAAPPNLTINVR
jgi:general secretion pathway protein D